MNTDQWIKQIIETGKTVAIPIMTHPGIELLGKKVKDAVTDGQTHYRAIAALNERFPQSAAVTMIMDLTVEAEAFGASLYMPDDEVPSVTGRLISGAADVAALKVPDIDAARVPEYLKASSLAVENLDKPVLPGCIGPYSLAARLFDMTELMMAMYLEPDTVKALLEKCTEFILRYCQAIKKTGAAGVVMAEPAAGLLSNEDCMTYSSVYVRQIIEKVQDEHFAVILHNCGNSGQCTEAMVATGAKGYHFGNRIDMVEALKGCPSHTLVMGNLDPAGVLKMSSASQVAAQVAELLQRTAGYPNFVLSTGCDVPPGVPMENITAFYAALQGTQA